MPLTKPSGSTNIGLSTAGEISGRVDPSPSRSPRPVSKDAGDMPDPQHLDPGQLAPVAGYSRDRSAALTGMATGRGISAIILLNSCSSPAGTAVVRLNASIP